MTATAEKGVKEEGKLCRIRYSKGETGWAFKLANGTYRINNLPLADGLNIDDIVECDHQSGELPIVKKVVEQGLSAKSAVSYQTVEQFHEFVKKATDAGCKCEGLVGPRKEGQGGDKDGIVIVAHKKDFDPFELAKEVGIKNADKFHRKHDKKSAKRDRAT